MKEQILSLLQQEKTQLGELLPKISARQISSYISEIVTPQQTEINAILADRNIVAQLLEKKVDSQPGLEGRFTGNKQILSLPVIQTGDHCELFYDPQVFANNFLYQLALEKSPHPYLIVQQCSTIRLIQGRGPLRGPGFIRLEGGIYRVFKRSKNNLNDCNVVTMGEVMFDFQSEDPGNNYELPELLKDLKGERFDNAVTAFFAANRYIWDNINIPDKKKLLLFDESLSSDTLIKFLEAPDHPLQKLFFEPDILAVFREVIRSYTNSPNCLVLKDTSDFFFGKYNEELVPLKFNHSGTTLISTIPKKRVEIEYTKQSIIENLRNRSIYPNLVSSFLAISIFPKITVLGGASQYEYMFEIQEILRRTAVLTNVLHSDYLASLTDNSLSKFIGIIGKHHPLYIAASRLDRGADLSKIRAELVDQTVDQCLGNYEKFRYLEHYFTLRRSKE